MFNPHSLFLTYFDVSTIPEYLSPVHRCEWLLGIAFQEINRSGQIINFAVFFLFFLRYGPKIYNQGPSEVFWSKFQVVPKILGRLERDPRRILTKTALILITFLKRDFLRWYRCVTHVNVCEMNRNVCMNRRKSMHQMHKKLLSFSGHLGLLSFHLTQVSVVFQALEYIFNAHATTRKSKSSHTMCSWLNIWMLVSKDAFNINSAQLVPVFTQMYAQIVPRYFPTVTVNIIGQWLKNIPRFQSSKN